MGQAVQNLKQIVMCFNWQLQMKTRAISGSDYSPAIALSEEKDKLV